jgi:hypothetical protein
MIVLFVTAFMAASVSFDLALDYRLAWQKRHRGAIEEATCQKVAMPDRLFPDPRLSD